MLKPVIVAIALGGVALARPADAQDHQSAPPPPPSYADPEGRHSTATSSTGVTMSLGGGVSDFVQGGLRDFTGTAGGWSVGVAIGTMTPLTFEATYTGTAQTIDSLGLDTDALLVSNGLSGAARLNLVMLPVTPYVLAGVGWRRYSVARSDTAVSDVTGEDDILEVPLGVGATMYNLGFIIDARIVYKHAFDDELMRAGSTVAEDDLHTLGANVSLGMAF